MTALGKKKLTSRTAAFGAALASLYVADDLQGAIVTLTFTNGTIGFNTQPLPQVTFDQIGTMPAVTQYNDGLGRSVRAIFGPQQTNFSFITQVTTGQTLDPNLFIGTNQIAPFATTATGMVYIGFRDGFSNVGWFSVNLGSPGNPVSYVTGQYGNGGETLIVGNIVIPEPSGSGLALLAMGAVGLRRRRKDCLNKAA